METLKVITPLGGRFASTSLEVIYSCEERMKTCTLQFHLHILRFHNHKGEENGTKIVHNAVIYQVYPKFQG